MIILQLLFVSVLCKIRVVKPTGKQTTSTFTTTSATYTTATVNNVTQEFGSLIDEYGLPINRVVVKNNQQG
jgi:hypothetical protein